MPSRPSSAEATSTCPRIAFSAIRISSCANDAPRQRRTPPPNGIQLNLPGVPSRKRSGRKRVGLRIEVRVVVHEVDAADQRRARLVGVAADLDALLDPPRLGDREHGAAAEDLL